MWWGHEKKASFACSSNTGLCGCGERQWREGCVTGRRENVLVAAHLLPGTVCGGVGLHRGGIRAEEERNI